MLSGAAIGLKNLSNDSNVEVNISVKWNCSGAVWLVREAEMRRTSLQCIEIGQTMSIIMCPIYSSQVLLHSIGFLFSRQKSFQIRKIKCISNYTLQNFENVLLKSPPKILIKLCSRPIKRV